MSSTSQKNGRAAGAPPGDAIDVQVHLQRLDRLANLGLISASIAHEMKNGLVAINTYCELLLEKSDNREMSGLVRRELKRINALATQMLRLAAPRPPAMTPVDVHELLDITLHLLEHQMNGRMIVLQRAYQAQTAVIRGDESRLQQVFVNLLLNAVEAMGQGGELTVTTESTGEHLKVTFRDTGMGIPAENLARIFETFFTTKKQGTGLGLAICRRVMEEHRGTIEVQSETDKGSTFVLTLPVK